MANTHQGTVKDINLGFGFFCQLIPPPIHHTDMPAALVSPSQQTILLTDNVTGQHPDYASFPEAFIPAEVCLFCQFSHPDKIILDPVPDLQDISYTSELCQL